MPRRSGTAPDLLILTPQLAPPYGGIERMAEDIATAYADRHVRVVGVSDRPSTEPNIRVVRLRRGRVGGVITKLSYTLAARAEIRRRPAVVQAMTWRAAAPYLFTRQRRPLALFCMGGELTRPTGRFGRVIRTRLLRRAAGVAAISHFTASLVRDASGREATVVHPPLRRLPTDPSPIAHDGLEILSVGRLEANKGHDRLIRAVGALRSQNVRAHLTIAGSGSELDRLQGVAAECDLSDQVRFAGAVSDEELDRLYRRADIFALLSVPVAGEVEGFGIVFLEANAYGLPVVAGRSGGSVDAVADDVSGLVVADHDATVAALLSLATNPSERARLGAQGRDRLTQFSMPEFRDQLAAFFAECEAAFR